MEAIGRMTGLRTPSEREFSMTRTIDAPREEVFKALLDPTLIPQWWGPRRLTTRVDHMETHPGGEWRFVQRDEQGKEYAFHGTYQEIDAPNRLEYTFEYEGMPGDVMVETVVLEDEDGKTRVRFVDLFADQRTRDTAMKSGMEEGATESMDRFEQLMAGRGRSGV
jgi:uncharacterized protein YndB with AHSA1/START domain